MIAGSYYNTELALHGQFVWLPKSAKAGAGPLWDYVQTLGVSTIRNVMEQGLYALLALVALLAVAVALRCTLRPPDAE